MADDPDDGAADMMMEEAAEGADINRVGDPIMTMMKSSSGQSSSALYRPYKEGFIIILTIVGSIGGFLFGYDTGIIAGAQLYFKDTWPQMTNVEREFAVSLALLGAFFGSLVAGPLSDGLGRKPIILASDVLFTAGSFIMAFAETIPVLFIGRFTVGLAVGVASMVTPVYLSEVSPNQRRGAVVTWFVLAITLGQLAACGVALLCGRNWRLMLGIAAGPAILQLIFMLFLPESQRWLAKKGLEEECLETLNRVYEEPEAQKELQGLQREVKKMRRYIDMTECQRYG